MNSKIMPSLWLLILIVGLPQLAETVYTPALPDIARSLCVSESWVEYTLTIFLFGFALGTLFWGKLSDKYGRKPCLLAGLLIFSIGCIGCFYSSSITMLLLSRLVQAFGGSTGSVLGQAICRDAFKGIERGKICASIGAAHAFCPAIGPVAGGLIAQLHGWPFIFIILTIAGLIVACCSTMFLAETHLEEHRAQFPFATILKKMIHDKKVIGYGLVVGGVNGISFSYYAEGSFYLMKLLQLTPFWYGVTFIVIACAGACGSYLSRQLHHRMSSFVILELGLKTLVGATVLFTFSTFIHLLLQSSNNVMIIITVIHMAFIAIGSWLIVPSALSLALEEYQHAIGSASSLFGFFYYMVISGATLIIGMLHNKSLLLMPSYFCVIAFLLWIVYKHLLQSKESNH